MKTDVFLACVLSHILFDFVFQVGKLIHFRFPPSKNNGQAQISKHNVAKIFKGNIFHAAMHFLGLNGILFYVVSIEKERIGYIFIISFFIFISHFIIDYCKSLIYLYDTRSESSLIIFFTDQLLHLSIIFILCCDFNIKKGFYTVSNLFDQYPQNMNFFQKRLIALVIFFIATWCTGIFIKLFIKKLDVNQTHIYSICSKKQGTDHSSNIIINENGGVIKTISQEAKNGGMIIGILERIFIIISILMNYSAVIGFVLTAKSFARLNKLSDESFAEYFIIGNLMSFISAVVAGILLKNIFQL